MTFEEWFYKSEEAMKLLVLRGYFDLEALAKEAWDTGYAIGFREGGHESRDHDD